MALEHRGLDAGRGHACGTPRAGTLGELGTRASAMDRALEVSAGRLESLAERARAFSSSASSVSVTCFASGSLCLGVPCAWAGGFVGASRGNGWVAEALGEGLDVERRVHRRPLVLALRGGSAGGGRGGLLASSGVVGHLSASSRPRP